MQVSVELGGYIISYVLFLYNFEIYILWLFNLLLVYVKGYQLSVFTVTYTVVYIVSYATAYIIYVYNWQLAAMNIILQGRLYV